MKLTATQVKQAKPKDKKYKLTDGGGLQLVITPSGSRYWQQRYKHNGKEKTLSIGTYPDVSLKDAREARDAAKDLLRQGVDPMRQKQIDRLREEEKNADVFEKVARVWHESKSDVWSQGHSDRVLKSLETRAFPYIGQLSMSEIIAPDILKLLRKMEAEGLGDSTRRMKQRINEIFLFAIAEGRITNNPVTGLEKALKPVPKVQHQKRLRVDQLGRFMSDLELYEGDVQTIYGLKLIVYTFVRTSELRFAEWSEFDLDKALWTIPAERMKMDEEHIVPLSKQVLKILDELKVLTGHQKYLLPSPARRGRPISENALIGAIYRMGYKHQTTVHGFRGTASTALNEKGFNRDVIERQLSHAERDGVRAAYNHAEYMEPRKEMMQWWSDRVDSLTKDEAL